MQDYGIYDEMRQGNSNIKTKIAKKCHVLDKNVTHDWPKIVKQENLAH